MQTITGTITTLETIRSSDKHTRRLVYNLLHNEFYGNKQIAEPNKRKLKHKKYTDRKHRKYTDQQCRQALELRAEGKGLGYISRETGIRKQSILWCISRMRRSIEALELH